MKRRSATRTCVECPQKLIKLALDSTEIEADALTAKHDPLNLTDLNDYCLEGIFKYLSLADLLNIAETNDRFVGEACLAARRLFRKKTVQINSSTIKVIEQLQDWNCIETVYQEMSFEKTSISTFFKHFGNEITILMVTDRFQTNDALGLSQFIDVYLQQLEHFKLFCRTDSLQWETEWKIIDNKVIENIKKFTTYSVPRIQFNGLEYLDIIQMVDTVDLDEVVNLICRNTGLVQLSMKYADWSRYELSDENIWMIINSLPNLSELTLEHDTVSVDGVETFLSESKSLKKFRLYVYYGVIGYEDFETYSCVNIGTNWKISFEFFDNYIYLLEFNRTE